MWLVAFGDAQLSGWGGRARQKNGVLSELLVPALYFLPQDLRGLCLGQVVTQGTERIK